MLQRLAGWSILLATVLSLSGCAAIRKVEIDGFTVFEAVTHDTLDKLRNRAAFDLSCDPNEIELNILEIDTYNKVPTTIGAHGCSNKAVYVRVPGSSQWVLNG